MLQETYHYEWQNLIALAAAQKGLIGEEELQLDSYNILSKQLEEEWVQSLEQRKSTRRPKGNKRAPKSAEQKRKISEAIAAKWADPALESVEKALLRLEELLQELHVSSSSSGKEHLKLPIQTLKGYGLKKEAEFLEASFRAGLLLLLMYQNNDMI